MSDPELCYPSVAQAIRRFTGNNLSPVELKQPLSTGGATTETPCQRLFSTTPGFQAAFVQPLYQPDTRISSGDKRC